MTGVSVLDRAVRNNAHWCDLVCRAHGARTSFDDDAWVSSTRTPPLYPDAVTLQPGPLPNHLLASVDATSGCSVKDSFATLDLAPHGFRVLFDAQWIAAAPNAAAAKRAAVSDPCWAVQHGPDEVEEWRRAWSDVEGMPSPFARGVLRHDDVAVVAARTSGRLVAGALLVRSSGVVAISNFFSGDTDGGQHWVGCLAAARSLYPEWTVVGYESGGRLSDALRNGFEVLGPLRVWING